MDDPRALDVRRLLDEQPVSPLLKLVFALCFLVVLFDGFDTGVIGYIAPSLVREWEIPRPALAPVLSAALFGLAAGALLSGPLADRFGRKMVLTVSVLEFGAATLASAFAGTLDQLVVWRFITGLGLGAAMPNAATLMSEFCSERRRALLTSAMFCGFPLGAALGGFLAAWMIPNWGWRSVLALGGVAPLLLAVALALLLPESVRYMVMKGYPAARIRAVLARISPRAVSATAFRMTEAMPAPGTAKGVRLVLSRPYVAGSAMLWLAYFMGLVVFYALVNWMPILFGDAGLAPRDAALIAALFPLGGIGAVGFGWLMDRYNGNWVIAAGFAVTGVAVGLIGQVSGQPALLVAAVFLAGAGSSTAQSALPALAAAFYPTEGRATGVGWMLGLGRFGGITGSFLVAELQSRQLPLDTIFLVVAVPAMVAAVALCIKQAARP